VLEGDAYADVVGAFVKRHKKRFTAVEAQFAASEVSFGP
jgi:hypothetical protein